MTKFSLFSFGSVRRLPLSGFAPTLFALSLSLGTLSLTACGDEQTAFDQTPTQRSQNAVEDLRRELIAAPHGWRVIYFPKTDSLLYSNPDEAINQTALRGSYGYGGHCFTMRFAENNTVETRADFDEETAVRPIVSEYTVNRNSFAQLSFATYTYVHRLANDRFEGASDWLYMGKDPDGNLMFRSANHLLPAREYIRLTRLGTPEETEAVVQQAVDNRLAFERMVNPQLRIYRGGRTYFQSDYFMKRNVETNQSLLREIKDKRYYLFVFASKRNPIPDYPPKEITGLGSGYTGTEQGLTFRAGLRFDAAKQFYDFERKGDRFEAELVQVYDTLLRSTRYVSKHLHPEGISTGIKAVIYDEGAR